MADGKEPGGGEGMKMSKRRHEANNYNVRIHIYDRDKRRCRWCGREVRFRSSTQRYYEHEDVDLFVVGHGIPFSQAPSWDDYDNWFTSCQECNARQGKSSTPPGPIIPDEVKITNWPNLVPVRIIKDPPPTVESWLRLSEQNLRIDKWSVCQG
jgi:hypothetical protein